jgi:chromate reductase, NAD(P)H dehydrogenase (quinone)
MLVLGIPGSLREGSYNRRLLMEAAELLPAGVEFRLFTELKAVPPFDEDDEADLPVAVERLRQAIAAAAALLFATPEYNASIPGQLKNAVDWASRPAGTAVLLGKPVAVIGASTGGFGAVWAQADLQKVLKTAGARVVDGQVVVPHAHVRLADQGCLLDDLLAGEVEELVRTLVAEATSHEDQLAA